MQVKLSAKPPQTRLSHDSIRSYLQEIGRIPLLSASEEVVLGQQVQAMMVLIETKVTLTTALSYAPNDLEWAQAAGLTLVQLRKVSHDGQRAKQRMIESNLRLVVSIAKKYQKRHLDFLDLIQEGSIGLERGVEKYNPATGYRFSTYAYWWIRQAITRAIAQQSRTIRLPIHITERLNKVKRTQRELSQSLGRTPTLLEVAQHLAIEVDEIKRCLQAAHPTLSLEMRVGEDGQSELQDLLEDGDCSPEQSAALQQFQQEMSDLIQELAPMQRQVLTLRFGLQNGEAMSLSSVGKEMGLSRERVRQIQQMALKKLRLRKSSIRDYLLDTVD